MKKLICIILIACAALFTLGACDNSKGGKTSGTWSNSASNSASNGGSIAEPDQEKQTFVVSIDNQAGDGATLTVRYLSSTLQPVEINDGDKIESGAIITATAKNDGQSKLQLCLFVGGSLVAEKIIDPKTNEQTGASVFGYELKSDLTVTLKTIEQTATITINDGAKSANSSDAVNALHVYDPTLYALGVDDDAYRSGEQVSFGRTVKIFVYNYATPVRLKITYKGQTVVDKVYAALDMEDEAQWKNGHGEYFEYTLDGDLQVETTIATLE